MIYYWTVDLSLCSRMYQALSNYWPSNLGSPLKWSEQWSHLSNRQERLTRMKRAEHPIESIILYLESWGRIVQPHFLLLRWKLTLMVRSSYIVPYCCQWCVNSTTKKKKGFLRLLSFIASLNCTITIRLQISARTRLLLRYSDLLSQAMLSRNRYWSTWR